jgi:hypothetical protein
MEREDHVRNFSVSPIEQLWLMSDACLMQKRPFASTC